MSRKNGHIEEKEERKKESAIEVEGV